METIMIQEADEATLDVVTTALQMEGYQVCNLTDNNENALDMIRRYHPKMILLDCWLRNNSAGQVSQWIKSHFPRKPKIPIDQGEGVPTCLAGFPKMALMHLAPLPNIQ